MRAKNLVSGDETSMLHVWFRGTAGDSVAYMAAVVDSKSVMFLCNILASCLCFWCMVHIS